jgi:hypothetical protein
MAIKRRDFLKASAAAGAALTLEGASEALKGAEDKKGKGYILPNVVTGQEPQRVRSLWHAEGCAGGTGFRMREKAVTR